MFDNETGYPYGYNGSGNSAPDSEYHYNYKTPSSDRPVQVPVYNYTGSYSGSPQKKKDRKSGNRILKTIALALVFGIVAGLSFTAVSYAGSKLLQSKSDSTETVSSSFSNSVSAVSLTTASGVSTISDVSDIVDSCMPSVVAITCVSQSEYYSLFGHMQSYESTSAGSGVIIAEDSDYLYISTNNHVVDGASTLTVTWCDGSTAPGEVKGTSSSHDLAVVMVSKSDISEDTGNTIKIAVWGDSDSLRVGEGAIAIGNALGYGQSATTGVISALDREVSTTDSSSGNTITNLLIQTDAAINPGNSGGALFNMNGEIIGITSSKYSSTDVEGMGYAIPTATAKPILEKLINSTKVSDSERSSLGISCINVTSSIAETYAMPEGVYVSEINAGSAAEKAGLEVEDVIIAFSGESISSTTELQEALAYCPSGSQETITVMRKEDGTYVEHELKITLDAYVQEPEYPQNWLEDYFGNYGYGYSYDDSYGTEI